MALDTNMLSRRKLLAAIASVTLISASDLKAFAQTRAKVVVIGGGFGGATAARFIKSYLPNTSVTLIEPNPVFTACPFSNLVIGGQRSIADQEFDYRSLVGDGIEIAQAFATDVDSQARTVTLDNGSILSYDRLIMSPGISIRWGALEGYDRAAAELMPHAWKAGTQTVLLRRQLEAMEDGGTVVMSAPAAPFRCPPGPYERASLIANYLKTEKPASKLIILDSKDTFSKMPLFQEAWAEHYPDHLEWRCASNDGRVNRVAADTKTLYTDFDEIRADVANVIPPQKAGEIAERAGVTDATGWCPINATSFESTRQPKIHVIGDATIANPMPKSAFSANLQAKVCAASIARLLSGDDAIPTTLANTCYSFIASNRAVSIAGVYRNDDGAFSSVDGAGGISPLAADASIREAEALQAEDWFRTITSEAFG